MDFYSGSDKAKEECGVFGIYDCDGLDVARMTYYGLYALQHRGQESAGIAVNNDGEMYYHKDLGLVPEVFNDKILDQLKGTIAVGHVRYSTKGGNMRENTQPLVNQYIKGTLALAHNGNLVNSAALRDELEKTGAIFHTSIDSEVIMYKIAQNRVHSHSIEAALLETMKELRGSYSIVMMSPRKLIGARDPYGFRPLCIGKKKNSYVLSSETCALENLGAEFIREVEPGEVVVIDGSGIRSLKADDAQERANICIFEYIYFARPDSEIQGASVYEMRRLMGRYLAQAYPVEADLVFGVPDSGLCAALGYAEESGIPYGQGFIKNRYVGRTFIQPTQAQREDAVNVKLNVLKQSVRGKRVVMVDDSIVRGTTSAKIIHQVKAAGAKEVHMRISAPPFLYPCYFGTDIPSRKDLLATGRTVEEMRRQIGADTLGFLSLEDVARLAKHINCDYCEGCFTGKYPLEVPDETDKHELKITVHNI